MIVILSRDAAMEAPEVIDIMREAIFVLIKISAPLMLVSLIIGLAVALFQALTQIQEMTLTFVPKMLGIFTCLILTMPFMIATLIDFTHQLAERMIGLD